MHSSRLLGSENSSLFFMICIYLLTCKRTQVYLFTKNIPVSVQRICYLFNCTFTGTEYSKPEEPTTLIATRA